MNLHDSTTQYLGFGIAIVKSLSTNISGYAEVFEFMAVYGRAQTHRHDIGSKTNLWQYRKA
jgi:hypothetical protein